MLLIDGYNVLFAGSPRRIAREQLPQAREDLLTRIARYCEVCGIRARVIFDFTQGPPIHGIAARKRVGNVEVWYTPKGIIADEEILGLIAGTRDRTAYTVVTSDRAIADPARKKLIQVIDSSRFHRELDRVLLDAEEKSEDAPEKGEGLKPGDVDYWMREFGLRDEEPK